MLIPRTARSEARVLRQRGLAEDLVAEAGEFALVLDAEENRFSVARPERPVRRHGGVRRAGARWGGAAVSGEIGGKAEPLAERFEHRDVECRALIGRGAPEKRREDPGERIHAGSDIGDRNARLRRGFRRAGHRKHAGLALHEEVIRALGAVGAVLAVAGNGAPDQAGVPRAQFLGAQPEPGRGTGRKVLDEDVRLSDELCEDRLCFRVLGVERQAFLRPVDPDEVRRKSFDRGVVAARSVANARALDLDHARAEFRELPRGERRRDDLLQSDDRDSRQRKDRLTQSRSSCRTTRCLRTASTTFRPAPQGRHRSACRC